MEQVNFTQMKDGTKEEYEFLHSLEQEFVRNTGDRLLDLLDTMGNSTLEGYRINRKEHCLQSGTRAYRDGADIDWVVSALLHDISDIVAPCTHDVVAAAIIRPFVREECSWVVEYHGIFQKVYYMHHFGGDQYEREQYKDHPAYQTCIDFCEKWDQNSFDPDYNSENIDFFRPMVREIFNRTPYDANVLKSGVYKGLLG
ncbi:MAG: peptidase [Alphaproteobacteria bacterium]|nr:peptidase [Alphaproteobacteria bacterium]